MPNVRGPNQQIGTWLTKPEVYALHAKAEASGMTISAFVRVAIRNQQPIISVKLPRWEQEAIANAR